MNKQRHLPSRDYLALKAAFRDLVASAGGPTRAADITRCSASLLSRYGAIHEETWAPSDVIADLEAEVGEPMVTRVLAELQGWSIVPKAAILGEQPNFVRHLSGVARETGDVLAALGDALSDGHIDERESEICLSEVREAQEKLAHLEQDLKHAAQVTPITGARRVVGR